LCDWATCNLTLHFSGTLLGSARGTGLLPVCGRNLYNCLCSFFLCSFHLSAAQRLWTHLDSKLLQTLNLRTVLQNVKEEVFKNTIQEWCHAYFLVVIVRPIQSMWSIDLSSFLFHGNRKYLPWSSSNWNSGT